MLNKIFNRTVRAWIYGVSAATLSALVYFGVLEEGAIAFILPIVLAVLNLNPKDEGGEGLGR